MKKGWERVLSTHYHHEGAQVPKLKDRCDEHEMKRDSLNAKAMNLVCALSSDELNRVCNYETVKKLGRFRIYTWGHKQSQENENPSPYISKRIFENENGKSIKNMLFII